MESSSCLSNYLEEKINKNKAKEIFETKKRDSTNNFEFYFNNLQEVKDTFNRLDFFFKLHKIFLSFFESFILCYIDFFLSLSVFSISKKLEIIDTMEYKIPA